MSEVDQMVHDNNISYMRARQRCEVTDELEYLAKVEIYHKCQHMSGEKIARVYKTTHARARRAKQALPLKKNLPVLNHHKALISTLDLKHAVIVFGKNYDVKELAKACNTSQGTIRMYIKRYVT